MQHVELRQVNDFQRRIAIQNVLKKYNLKYNCTEQTCRDNSVKVIFSIQPEIKIKLAFTGNPEGDSFKVVVTNAGGMVQQGRFGEFCFPRITPNQVGIEAIEALIRFIARQPHQLFYYWALETPLEIEQTFNCPPLKESLRKQTYDFDILNITNVLSKLSSPNPRTQKSSPSASTKRTEIKESVAEHHQRVQAEHDKFMSDLSKIHATFERGHAKKRSVFGWLTSILPSSYKKNEC
jgi:hypothetical protein